MAARPALYDVDRLGANTVPVAAAIYQDDMYLDRDLAIGTAGAIRGLRPWITDAYQHDGLRTSGGAVLDQLISLLHGTP
ncbi:Proline iminopeptidase [Streptomyces hundungensis]|uniref:Proline iminopeptidase n=1 Tax=Streptomyces hundungensis TaxID=1077946 RepID=A0A387HLU1_9ACTN|nr:Proline iminopeptidase [Streptomyces hundungensis]